MFKTIPILVMATLCLIFSANAQGNKAIDVTTKGIQIGQKVPDVLIQNIHNYKTADGKTATTAKLSDFKGKLLILDFWATWCSPCVGMIPKMDSLQSQFEGKVQFLSLTYQSETEVLSFLEKLEKKAGKHYNLPVITDDKALHKLFPHIYLPHYAWIDQNGMVKAITGYDEITAQNIEKMIVTGNNHTLNQKRDMRIVYDTNKPYLINGNGGDGSNLLFHSALTGYNLGIPGGYSYGAFEYNGIKGRRVTGWNQSIPKLYMLALAEGKKAYGFNRLIIETKDSAAIAFQGTNAEYAESNWKQKNEYCYELVTPKISNSEFYSKMKQDLDSYFSRFTITLSKRMRKCLALVSLSKELKLETKGGSPKSDFSKDGCILKNTDLNTFVSNLNLIYLQTSTLPVIDNTDYNGNVDMELSANLTNVTSINKALAKYNLSLIEKDLLIDMIIISDRIQPSKN